LERREVTEPKPADYQKSYWKAVELQEKVEQGKIKIHKNYVHTVIQILRDIQNAAWESSESAYEETTLMCPKCQTRMKLTMMRGSKIVLIEVVE